ncbi:hypothetical protein PG985_009999 [Apiospora marii]|uniref:uncharacterized protein n=1 Tax=Apiospora marii TaxID=335849 RepID=UPI003131348F
MLSSHSRLFKFSTFPTELPCDDVLLDIAFEGYFPDTEELEELCHPGCLRSLESLRNAQHGTCASTVQPNDSCWAIISTHRHNFGRVQLLSWDTDIDNDCTNLEMLTGHWICVSLPGAASPEEGAAYLQLQIQV